MSVCKKILTGAAGLAAVVGFASPAAAQYYPSYPGPNYGYGYNNNGGVLGAIINGVIGGGYGQYPYGNYGYGRTNDRVAVDQCVRAVEARLNNRGGYGYSPYGYNPGYGGGRVMGITKVEGKSYGLKVFGVASSGNRGYDPYNRYGYGNYNAGADLKFNCEMDRYGRIRDVDVGRR